MSTLQDSYVKEIRARVGEKVGQSNVHAIPRLVKIVVSMGLGKAQTERKRIDEAVAELALITGQKPIVTKSKNSISGFRLREGVDVGCCVTLRKRRMYEFLERLTKLALPRVRDFRGVNPDSFDGRGNYSMGVNEQSIFPEINPDKVVFVQGMNIAIVTTANTDDEGRELLQALGMPFRKESVN